MSCTNDVLGGLGRDGGNASFLGAAAILYSTPCFLVPWQCSAPLVHPAAQNALSWSPVCLDPQGTQTAERGRHREKLQSDPGQSSQAFS